VGERVRRACAIGAGLGAAFAAVAIGIATVATGTVYGYVSEAGAPGAPLRGLYRAGVLGVAVALALLVAAMPRRACERGGPDRGVRSTAPGNPSRSAVVRGAGVRGAAVGLALAAAAPLAAASAVVSCTPGCPLPPYERASQSDNVHALASIGGFALAVGAMLLLAFDGAGPTGALGPLPSRLRAASRVCAGLLVPLLAAAGLTMLVTGRGLLAGLLERGALAVALAWLGTAAAMLATRRPPDDAAAAPRSLPMRRRT
jgi:hypothetical protein